MAISVLVNCGSVRADCETTKDNIIGIEALCLYAESSALQGHLSTNPLRLQAIQNFVSTKDPNAEIYIDTGGFLEYLRPFIKTIHDCYIHKKTNMCDVFRGD